MAVIQQWFDTELASLRTLRDKVRVRAHLFQADVREEWAKVEVRLDIIESEVLRFKDGAREPLADAGDAAKQLLAEAREAISRIEQRSSAR